MTSSRRQNRIRELLRDEIGRIIRNEMSDGVSSLMSITTVEVSKDLGDAKVYVSFLDGENTTKYLSRLKKAEGFIRSELNKAVRLKRMPRLNFYLDDTIAKAFKLEKVFDKIHEEDKPDAMEIADKLIDAERILLVTHVFPDGDNMGSCLALMRGLKSIGKDVYFYLHGDVPRIYSWLPGSDEIKDQLPSKDGAPWLMVAIDCADMGRMGQPFVEWYETRLTLINIDHHVSNDYYGDIDWVEPDYSSTGEMVIEILDSLGIDLDHELATCIYCAVLTDSGRFGYSNTNLRTISVATRCVEAGANPHKVYTKVYSSRTLAGLKLLKMALGTIKFFAHDAGVAFFVDRAMFDETGTDVSDTENFLETVTQVGELRIVVFFKEITPGIIKASLRCRAPISAYELAAKFKGGGHPRAAGFSFDGTMEEAYDKFLAEAEKVLAADGG